jgi:hypothetical protein
MPALKARLDARTPGAPAIASPKGSRLGLENWKPAVDWRRSATEIGRPNLRVHDLRHTYASLSRRAGADLRLVARAGIEPATFRFSGGRSYRLSYLAGRHRVQPGCLTTTVATLTGLEPATSAVTGRRANQLRHRALLYQLLRVAALRTRATAVKGRRPRPLDDGGQNRITPGYSQRGSLEPSQLRSPGTESSNGHTVSLSLAPL